MTRAGAPSPVLSDDDRTASPEQLQARARLVIDQAPDAYVSVGPTGEVVEWNPAAETTFGWTRAEMLGRDVGEVLLSDRRAALHRSQVIDFRRTRSSTMLGRHADVPMSHRDGRLMRVDCVVWSVVDDAAGTASLHTFMRDVSGRQAAADDLRRAHEDLSTFSAAMAHDLRTPLTGIKLLAQLLETELEGHGDAIDLATRIDRAADRGVQLVDDVLGYLEIGRVLAHRSPVDLTPLVERVVAEQVAAAGRPALIDVRRLPAVTGDERLLARLFSNLVGNALKHVPSDRTVEITVDAEPDAEAAVIRVRDNGEAIDPADRTRIFVMFERAASSAPLSGSGVGLAVSRRVAELHDGSIELDPSTSSGNRFRVRLGL